MSFVSVTDVFQSYGPRPILERVNVTVDEGEFISIVGASGVGKSTFLHILGGVDRPTEGKIFYRGVSLAGMGEKALAEYRNAEVGFVGLAADQIRGRRLLHDLVREPEVSRQSPDLRLEQVAERIDRG